MKDITNLQKKRAAQLKVVLGNISRALGKLEVVISEAKTAGKDTTIADADLVLAKTAVADALASINAFASKDFTPTITSESTLKTDLSATRNIFASDIEGISVKIKAARAAATKVLVDMKTFRKGTIAPTVNPTEPVQ